MAARLARSREGRPCRSFDWAGNWYRHCGDAGFRFLTENDAVRHWITQSAGAVGGLPGGCLVRTPRGLFAGASGGRD
jgi:hypothetical protein